jgi:hypothetical protein
VSGAAQPAAADRREVSDGAFTRTTLGLRKPDGRSQTRSVDDGSPCGQPFQEAAALLVDPEDEPDGVEDFDADPEPDESEEDDDDADESTFFSVFFSPGPLSFEPLSFEPLSFDEDPFDADLADSRLSLR